MSEVRIDALLPSEMAARAEEIGIRKAQSPFLATFALSVLAGAFISLGAIFATTTTAGLAGVVPYGLARAIIGLTFCLGLILVVVGGAELFTGNNMIVMAWASRKVTTGQLLANWVTVYAGNFAGSIGMAVMVFLARHYTFGDGAVGVAALKIASGKVHLGFIQAVSLGVLCNVLVCLAVWLTYSARSTIDRIVAIIFPITAFVAAGFEHCIANMYFVPYALLIRMLDPGFVAGLGDKVDVDGLTWDAFCVNNLVPVTIGNVVGGAFLVAAVYWSVFLRHRKA